MHFEPRLLACALGYGLASVAQAQPITPATDGPALPAVEVRATAVPASPLLKAGRLTTGTDASTLDTPFSASSLPTEVLREQGGTSLQEALRNIPGAQADSGFNGAHAQFFILRGAIADSATGSSRVLRDGVRLSNYPFAAAFVESVDVLRGPGAAIGVRSEPGGTVNLVTRQPQLANFSSVGASVGAAGAMQLSADINRILSADGGVAARIIATHSASSEWRHVPDKLDGLKLGIAKDGGEHYQLRAGVEIINQAYQPDYGIPSIGDRPVDVPRDRQFGEPWADSTTRNRILDLHGEWALAPATRLAVDFTHLDARSTSLKSFLTGSPLPVTPATPYGTFARGAGFEPGTDRRIDSLAASVTSRQQWGGVSHTLFAGLDHYREMLDQPSLAIPAGSSPPINVFDPVYGQVTPPAAGVPLAQSLTTQDLRSTAASLQDQIDIGDWTVVAGLRLTTQKFVYGAAGTRPVDETAWSPKLAVLRRVSDAHSVYANVARGMAPNQVSSSSQQSLPSRRSKQIEAGWKALWRDAALTSDIALYRLDQTHMISADQSTPFNNFDFTVDGSGRSQGVEMSLAGELTERVSVRAAYAYTHARVLANSLLAGKAVPNVATHAGSVWAQYRWTPAAGGAALQSLTGIGIYAQGDRFADRANTVTLPGYARLDVTQTWRQPLAGGQSLEVQLALRNALDKAYFVSSHLHVARWVMPAQGRNLMLSALYKF
ncbi:MAG: TonB-dependent siderophore receptor [Polaromonas sp.]|nr:TonB-dependent siderophore receptor [Polaromonas sp.]